MKVDQCNVQDDEKIYGMNRSRRYHLIECVKLIEEFMTLKPNML